VRHGETEWNLAGKEQGHLDSPLTALGVRQAQALANGLWGKGIQVIYSSDLGRAVRTAEIIADRLGLPLNVESDLRERHLGVMQGLTMKEFRDRFPDEAAADTMRTLADGVNGDAPVVAGESGCAGVAGLIAAINDGAAKETLGLGADSRVLCICTEGATDPALYAEIVGKTPEQVMA